jgi:hypothetical protein
MSKMNVGAWFATPICSKFLTIDNKAVEQFCYQQQESSGIPMAPGGWQSGMIDINDPALEPLVSKVKYMLEEVKDMYTLRDDYASLELDNAWININSPGLHQLADNFYHLHPGYFFSFVFYVKAKKNAGNLCMISPNPMIEYMLPDLACEEFGMLNASRFRVAPVEGKLIAFPAWIQHFVEPNHSSEDRISIAFNARLNIKERR